MFAVADYINTWATPPVLNQPLGYFYGIHMWGRVAFLYGGTQTVPEEPSRPLFFLGIQRGRPVAFPLATRGAGLWGYPKPRRAI